MSPAVSELAQAALSTPGGNYESEKLSIAVQEGKVLKTIIKPDSPKLLGMLRVFLIPLDSHSSE
jgi:hypothetical protein